MNMFFLKRLGRAVVTLLLIVTASFIILRASGDPAVLILSVDTPQETREAFRHEYGLDKPMPVQYILYMKAVFRGDFGQSMRDGRDALQVVMARVPITLALTIPAFLLTLIIGIPAGIWAAANKNSIVDRLTIMFAISGYTVPSFVLGAVFVLIFSVKLRWLPSGGSGGFLHAILPVMTLGLYSSALVARFTRSAMLDALDQPYVRTALAKGVRWPRVVISHALPNAAIPLVTLLGLMVGNLVVGAVIVENVFAWPGIGRLIVTSVETRDLAVVQCILFMVGVTMVGSNLIVDVLYGWIDPRIKAKQT